MHRRSLMKLMWMLASLLWLVGCSTSGSAPSLVNSTWQLQRIDDVAVPAGVTVTIVFDDGQIGGNGGCNSYGGSYQLQGSALRFADVFMTEMYCEGAGSTTEQQYMTILMEIRSFVVTTDAGTTQLTLQDANQRPRLVFVQIEG